MTNKFLQSVLAKKASSKKQNGFTLIELMVVVAIVGILSAVGLPELTKAQDRAKDAADQATLSSAAKECSLALIADDTTLFTPGDYEIAGTALTTTTAPCAVDELMSVEGTTGSTIAVQFRGATPGVVTVTPASDDNTPPPPLDVKEE